jgi:leucyl aminopeptidase (aminopeptidase T)
MAKQEENIAKNVVKGLKIGSNDVLLIETNERMSGLANQIAITARRLGAETHTRLNSDDVWYTSITELPLDWLKAPDRLTQNIQNVVTASVYMGGMSDPTKFRKIAPERWEANTVGAEETFKGWKDLNIRSLDLTLGMVTTQRAKAYGFPLKDWKKSVIDAMSADYGRIAMEAKRFAPILENGRTVRITGKKTDLTFELASRKPRVYDGTVDEEDLALKNSNASLPDGAIAVAPREESANGEITFDIPIPAYGKLIEGLRWTIKKGMLTDFTAEKNLDLFEMNLKNIEKSKNAKRFGAFIIGLNPKAKLGFLQNHIARGAITIGIGNNEELGGDNVGGMAIGQTLGKGTVTIDKKELVKNGKIVV